LRRRPGMKSKLVAHAYGFFKNTTITHVTTPYIVFHRPIPDMIHCPKTVDL
jgi:hypothetical protein